MGHDARVNLALSRLADSLQIPCDIITVHREHWRESRSRPFESLRYGALLLALAGLDAYFTAASGFCDAAPGRALGINPNRVREAFAKHADHPNIHRHWRARVRVASEFTGATYRRAPWVVLSGQGLTAYLEDLADARNVLAHGGDKSAFTNRSGALHPLRGGGYSFRLMTVEGAIQAIEDIASETALALTEGRAAIPDWPVPKPTQHSLSGRLPVPY